MANAMRSGMKKILLLITCCCLVVVTYAEDVPDAELFGGFSYTRGDIDLNMYGWNASIAGVINPWFSIVGDLSGHYVNIAPDFVEAGLNMHSVAIGPQFSARGDSAVGFARVLIGANRIGGTFANCGGGRFYLAFTAGGGVDIPLNERLAIRVIQADWVHIRVDEGSLNQARVSAGLVVRF